jgi:hypothetical protein
MPTEELKQKHGFPECPTEELKQKRMNICRQLLLRYEHEGDEFLCNIVTGDRAGCIVSSPKAEDIQWNTVTKVHQDRRSLELHLLLAKSYSLLFGTYS